MTPPALTRSRSDADANGSVRIVHLTSAHSADDSRIFVRECRSLAQMGYDVHVVAPDTPHELREDVHVWGVAERPGSRRATRMTRTVAAVYRRAHALDADIYQFHDPELLLAGLLLSRSGKRVIYDVHEDVPASILTKPWIKPRLRRPIAALAGAIERFSTRRFAGVVAATPAIRERFAGSRCEAITVANYPALADFDRDAGAPPPEGRLVCYVGAISEIRAADVMVQAVARIDAKLLLAGWYSSPDLRDRLATLPGWSRVVELGLVGQRDVVATLRRSRAGLVLFLPLPNHVNAQPTKLYEYMAAGLPVIASSFPRWRAFIEGAQCGLCVDPTDPAAVAEAIEWILDHPKEAAEMGRNGRRAVERHYAWESEARKLAAFYESLLRSGPGAARRADRSLRPARASDG
jgi:glycosyltransferase involved in cell wall biosynthesis